MVFIKIRGVLADMLADIAPDVCKSRASENKKGNKQLLVQRQSATRGTMAASLLCCRKFCKSLTDAGFKFDPRDPCVANKIIKGNQMTICFHVDDCKLSHASKKEMDKMIGWLKEECESVFEDGSGKMAVSRGKIHTCLGVTLDCTTPGQVKITMTDCIEEIIVAFEQQNQKARAMRPAPHHPIFSKSTTTARS